MQGGAADPKGGLAREGTLSAANFGPKYEQHVGEMQKQLDTANKT